MTKIKLDRETFKALASDTRLDLLKTLDGKHLGLNEIAKVSNLNKATLHEHLTKLHEAGLIKRTERDGHKWVYYKLTWKGESLLHPENAKIVVLFTTTFVALWLGIIQMISYIKGTVTDFGYNLYTIGDQAILSSESLIATPTINRKNGKTKNRLGLTHAIPHVDIDRPGFLEADTVAHCGSSMAGSFIWSTTFTDIFSQWTENRAVWNKGSADVLREVKELEKGLPFELLGFDVDNGSEFLTFHLWRYLLDRPRPISMTRSRAYRKNDQAHVEQKNWTHVRQLLGYQRLEQPELIPLINDLYRTWARFHNFFCPTLKLLSKTRKGSKTLRKYSKPQTPYQRLLEYPHLSQEPKGDLRAQYQQLNPFELKEQIEQKLKLVFDRARVR